MALKIPLKEAMRLLREAKTLKILKRCLSWHLVQGALRALMKA